MTVRDARDIYGYVARLSRRLTPEKVIEHLQAHRGLLRGMIQKFPFRLPPCVDEDDLCQELSTALLRALRTYDPLRGNLEAHLEWNVIRDVRQWARHLNPLGRYRQEQVQLVSDAWWVLAQRNHRLPGAEDLAGETGMAPHVVQRILNAMEMRDILPLDTVVGDVDVPEPGADPFEVAWHGECLRHLGEALAQLSPTERRLMGLCYGQEMTMRQVALQMGISTAGAGRLHQQMLLRLRSSFTQGRPQPPQRPCRPAEPPVPSPGTVPYVDYERRPWNQEQKSSTWWARTVRMARRWVRDFLSWKTPQVGLPAVFTKC